MTKIQMRMGAGLLAATAWGLASSSGETRAAPDAGSASSLQGTRRAAAPNPVQRRSKAELLNIIRAQPDGPALLRKATAGRGAAGTGSLSSATAFSVLLDLDRPRVGNHYLEMSDVAFSPSRALRMVYRTYTVNDKQPWAAVKLAFPKHGWYLLNFEFLIFSSTGAKFECHPAFGEVIGKIEVPGTAIGQHARKSFPVLYEYKGESDRLFFTIRGGAATFDYISAESL